MKKFIISLSIAIILSPGIYGTAQVKGGFAKQTAGSKSHLTAFRKIIHGQLGNKIDTYLSRMVPFGFSGSMLVAKNDQIILLKGYGLANRERQTPVDEDTVFYIGSITKQFTAAAILKLEMQGKLRVTDTLDKFFKDAPPDKAKITIHQLLTHSSGMGGADDIYGSPAQKDEQARRVMAMKLPAEPGKEYFYSNPAYNLLGIIVENVSGQTYERFLHENLFKPAGMLKTGYRIPKWESNKVAHGYSGEEDKGSPLARPWLEDGPSWQIRGAGGMLSTIGDLYRWHLALEKDEILSDAAKSKIFSPHVKMEGNTFYGYGWSLQKTPRATNLIAHNGSDGIFFADFRRYVDEDVVVIGVTNDIYGASTIESKVPELVFGGANIKFPPIAAAKNISQAVLQKYPGTYRLPSGATIRVTIKGNRLILDPVGQEAVNLLTNVQPMQAENFEKLNVKSKAILDAAAKNDFSPLKTVIAAERFEVFKSFLAEILELPEDGKSSPANYSIIGTHPLWFAGNKPIATFVRLNNSKEANLVLFTWENDRIRGRGFTKESDDISLRTPFVARSQKNFVGFHAGLETPLSIAFKTNQKGEPISIEFQTQTGTRTAHRVVNP